MATVDLSLTGFDITDPAKPTITHDPDAILDYTENWEDWLTDGDVIVSAGTTVTFPDTENTMTLTRAVAISPDGFNVTGWITGGRPGQKESVRYHIVTQEGREDDRTLYFKVKER